MKKPIFTPLPQCNRAWDELRETPVEGVRFCTHCMQNVFRVTDTEGIKRAVAEARRVYWKRGGGDVFIGVVVEREELEWGSDEPGAGRTEPSLQGTRSCHGQ